MAAHWLSIMSKPRSNSCGGNGSPGSMRLLQPQDQRESGSSCTPETYRCSGSLDMRAQGCVAREGCFAGKQACPRCAEIQPHSCVEDDRLPTLGHSAAARPHTGCVPAFGAGLQSDGLMLPVHQILCGGMPPAASPVPLAGAHDVLVEAAKSACLSVHDNSISYCLTAF